MRHPLLCLTIVFFANTAVAQKVYNIKADSAKITNSCDTAELILENHTQNIPGFLFNKGRGRTEFRKILQFVDDSTYYVGIDTLRIKSGISGRLEPQQVAFGSSSKGITGSNAFMYDSLQMILTLGKTKISTKNFNFLASHALPPLGATGRGNVGIGMNGLFADLTSGEQNVAIGDYTMTAITTGKANVGVAPGALQRLTTGQGNTAMGYQSLQWLTTQNNNTGLGTGAFAFATLGTGNVSIGGGRAVSFSPDINIGNNNVFIGYRANDANSTLDNNVVIGNTSYTSGTNNSTLIGTGMNTSLSNIVGIGRSDQNIVVGATSVTADNGARLQIIGNETITGNLSIGGISAITAKLHIAGGSSSPGSAPIKLDAGPVLTTPENGTIEFDGTDYYMTSNLVRYKLSKVISGNLTTDFGGHHWGHLAS